MPCQIWGACGYIAGSKFQPSHRKISFGERIFGPVASSQLMDRKELTVMACVDTEREESKPVWSKVVSMVKCGKYSCLSVLANAFWSTKTEAVWFQWKAIRFCHSNTTLLTGRGDQLYWLNLLRTQFRPLHYSGGFTIYTQYDALTTSEETFVQFKWRVLCGPNLCPWIYSSYNWAEWSQRTLCF